MGRIRLTGKERATLRRQAHNLQPVAIVGRSGLTDAVRRHVAHELDQHELIKVRFTDHKEETRAITQQVGDELEATVVEVIGHVGILYRRAPDSSDRHRFDGIITG